MLLLKHTKLLLLLIFLGLSVQGFAAKTDTIYLNNGDRITGEVKKMEYGILEYKTDNVGTLKVEWNKIDSMYCKQFLLIRLGDGKMIYGLIEPDTVPFYHAIVTGEKRYHIWNRNIIEITQLKQEFLKRIKGRIGLGFNYTKASEVTQFNFDTRVSYNWKKQSSEAKYEIITSDQPSKVKSQRQNASLDYSLLLQKNFFAVSVFRMEQNSELGLDLRTNLGIGFGNNVIYRPNSKLQLAVGINGNREMARETKEEQYNLEGVGYIQYTIYRKDDPEIDFTNHVTVYPSLTSTGRYRTEFDSKLSYEIIEDLWITWKLYLSRDSQPLVEQASNNDWGINLGISYSW